MWLLGFGWAVAQTRYTVDEPGLGRLVRDLVPVVEEVAGRRFSAIPPAAIRDRGGFAREVGVAARAEALTRGLDAEGTADLVRRWTEMGEDVMALYQPGSGRMVFFSDNIERFFAGEQEDLPYVEGDLGGLPDDLLVPVLQCVAAHELTHALQHQAGLGEAEGADEVRVALLEGQAELVAEAVCRRLGHLEATGVLRQIGGWVEGQSRLATGSQLRYGTAPAWLDRRTGGVPARAWALLEASLPDLATVEAEAAMGCTADDGIGSALGVGEPAEAQRFEGFPIHASGYLGHAAIGRARSACVVLGTRRGRPVEVLRLDYAHAVEADGVFAGLAQGWVRFSAFLEGFRGTGFGEGRGYYRVFATRAQVAVIPGRTAGPVRASMVVRRRGDRGPATVWAFRRDASLFVLWGEGRLTGAERRALVALGRPVD